VFNASGLVISQSWLRNDETLEFKELAREKTFFETHAQQRCFDAIGAALAPISAVVAPLLFCVVWDIRGLETW
jgi:hypothetical protein